MMNEGTDRDRYRGRERDTYRKIGENEQELIRRRDK